MESTEAEKAPNENFETFDQPFESSSEEEWNPSNCSEDEYDTDINTLVVGKRKRNNNCVTQQFKFNCTVENCEAVYRKKWLLEDHIRKHNKERPFHCTTEECNKSFTKEAHLKRHKILVHEKSCELVCDVKGCGLIYNNKYSLKKHKIQVHNALKWPFFCNECCIGYKKKWQLNQHNYKHTGDPPFKCTLCNIGFTLQRDLTKHNRNHRTYTCDCGQIFDRWSHLNNHKKKCSTKKDHICTICDKTFSKKENLTAHHASIHQESKEPELFHCPYLNCTRSYKYKKNVNFHISVFHEKNKREEIPCPTCGKIFHMQVYLKRHIETMHKLPKISKPRATRKDKNKSRTYTAAVLAGLKLSQKGHIDLLKNHKKLIIRISRIDLSEIKTKLNKSSDDLEQMDRTELLKDLALIEKTNNIEGSHCEKTTEKLSEDKSIMIKDNITNCDKLKDLEPNIQLKNVNDINNERVEESNNGILRNEMQTTGHDMGTNISRKDVTEIENKVNKINDVKQTDTNKLKQTNKTHIVLLNLGNTTGTLSEDKSITIQDNSTNSDSIIDLEQNIQLTNLTDKDNQRLEAADNEVLENVVQTTERYQISTNISRIAVTKIENKINKSNDVEQTDTSELKEIPIEHTKEENIVVINLEKTTDTLPEISLNSDTIIDLEPIIKPTNVNFMINNKQLDGSANVLLENQIQTTIHKMETNISREDVTEIENEINKSNDVKQTNTNTLKVAQIEQTNKIQNIVVLNLDKGTLAEDTNINSDTIIDFEQNIKPKNVNGVTNNELIEAFDNGILVQTADRHKTSINLFRKDVTEIGNKVNKLNDVEQTYISELQEILLKDQNSKKDSLLMEDLNEPYESSEESDPIDVTEIENKVNKFNDVKQISISELKEQHSKKDSLLMEDVDEPYESSEESNPIDVTEIENKVNKFNDVKQTCISELKEISLKEQHSKKDSLLMEDLDEPYESLEESNPIDVTEIENKVNKFNDVKQTCISEIKEISLKEQHSKKDSLLMEDLDEPYESSEESNPIDVTEIENKVNKFNDVKQTCISELKEISLKEQHSKKDSLLLEDLDEPYESSEEEWNQTDHSEDEFDTDISTSAVTTKRENYVTRKLKFRCSVENCEAVYRKKWLLDDHIRKHNKERPFHCTIEECKKSFTKEAHLKRHNILVHEKSGELACDVKGCGLIYNNKYSLKKHKNQVHNALKWPFFCNECYMGFKKKWQLNQHNYKHTGEPPFKCTTCNIGFTVQRDLTKHNRNHKTYTCDCGQIFERWSHLNHHKKKCSAKNDNICKICDKRFSKKENLTAHHASIHQEPKESELFHCPFLNCTRSYKYKKNVNFHISFFHEKNKREAIPCPTCGKIFHMPLYLNRHIEKMHKLPKISKPRATRKDKNKSRTYTAAVLAGLKLSQKEHMDFLKNPKKQLSVRISRIDFGEIETKVNKSNDDEEQTRSNELIDIGLTEQINKKDDILILNLEKAEKPPKDKCITIEDNGKNGHTLIDLEQNIQLTVLDDIHRTELSFTGILQNEVQTTHSHKINTNISTFSDDVVVACNSVLKIIEECIV